jgi:hypothetical protein
VYCVLLLLFLHKSATLSTIKRTYLSNCLLCNFVHHWNVTPTRRLGQPLMQEDIVRPIRRMFGNFNDPGVVESFMSEPNKGLNNRTQFIFAGNTLGGTSAINGAQFSRPESKVCATHASAFALSF